MRVRNIGLLFLLVFIIAKLSLAESSLLKMSRAIAARESIRIIGDLQKEKKLLLEYFPRKSRFPVAGAGIKVRQDGYFFVSIASYRDPEIVSTVKSLLENSNSPQKLVLCICLQDDAQQNADTSAILGQLVRDQRSTLKLLTMPYTEARGPTWARYLIQRKWWGEQYYLQIDSHMRFIKGWDKALLDSLSLVTTKKACLTNYVSLYDRLTERRDNRHRLPLNVVRVESDGLLRANAGFTKIQPERPQQGCSWAGCFSFSSSELIHDAPYDPYLPYLFFGEEVDVAARLHAAGWSFFAPEKPILYTTFVRNYRPLFWGDHENQKKVEQLSRLRLYYRLGLIPSGEISHIPDELLIDVGPYYLGLQKYIHYSTAAQRYRYTPSVSKRAK